jgi:putative colanic acid biosynthesis glycosyltransferase
LSDACITRGYKTLIIFGRGQNEKGGIRVASSFDNELDGLNSRLFDNQGFNSIRTTIKTINLLRDFKPDVIHLHNLHGYYLNLPLLFHYLTNEFEGRIVWTLHDCWAFTGHCGFPPEGKCTRWQSQNGCHDCPYKNRYPKSILFDNSSKNWHRKNDIFSKVPAQKMILVTPSACSPGFYHCLFLTSFPLRQLIMASTRY